MTSSAWLYTPHLQDNTSLSWLWRQWIVNKPLYNTKLFEVSFYQTEQHARKHYQKYNLFWLCHQFQAKIRTGRSWSSINVLSAGLELSNTVMHIGRRQEKGCIAKAKVTNLPFLTSLLFSFLFQRSLVSLNVPVSSHKPTHTHTQTQQRFTPSSPFPSSHICDYGFELAHTAALNDLLLTLNPYLCLHTEPVHICVWVRVCVKRRRGRLHMSPEEVRTRNTHWDREGGDSDRVSVIASPYEHSVASVSLHTDYGVHGVRL